MCRGDGSCPDCNPELAEVWRMRNDPHAYSVWLTHSQQRHAAARGMRLATADDADQLAAMAAFRRSFYETAFAVLEPATSRVHLEPPDPWAAALDARRKELQ